MDTVTTFERDLKLLSDERKKWFEFADHLHFYYRFSSDASDESKGTCSINDLILRNLGKEKYQKFCEQQRTSIPLIGRFKAEFIGNPVKTTAIVFDCQVRKHWRIGELMDAVKEAL